MYYVTWLFLATLVDTLAVIYIKDYADNNKEFDLFLGIIMYIILLFAYVNIFRQNEVSKSYTVLMAIQAILIVIYGFYLGESITKKKILGLLLAIGAIYLLEK